MDLTQYIDVRSDTVTKPTENMKKSILTSKVDDDVLDKDPTTYEL